MNFEILAADSLGVRSLAIWIPDASGGGLLIDPGAALGPRRFGRPPHPREEAALMEASQRLSRVAEKVHRIAITHFHHDHFVPFKRQRWIASGKELARKLYREKIVYLRDPEGPINPRQRGRARKLASDLARLGVEVEPSDDRRYQGLQFSPPVRHGDANSPGGWVVMVCAAVGGARLVHMSDTQLLNNEAVAWALDQKPAVVISAGPPLYLPQLQAEQVETARHNLHRLVAEVPHVVLDHHLRRGGDIEGFLSEAARIASPKGHRLESAAAASGQIDRLLEARRRDLYKQK